MSIGNAIVMAVLRSPAHRLLSGGFDVVRYTGRRSGRQFSTPTQYARLGDDMVIFVARSESKTWWRNFLEERPIQVLVQGEWLDLTARAVVGADEPDIAGPLLDAYLERFPKATKALSGTTEEERVRGAVLIWCRPQ